MFEAVPVLESVLALLGEAPVAEEDAARIEQIRLLEQLRSATAAVQARVTAAFVSSQREQQRARGVPADLVGRGIAGPVGFARRISPHQATVYVGWAMIAAGELPETFAALQAGRTSEWRARIVARETVFLSRAQRAAVDRDVAPRLADWGDRAVETEVKKRAYRLDPQGFTDRLGNAAADRRVTIRPAPDTMTRVSALLPVRDGVAVHAALTRHAEALIGTGEHGGRSRGQIMADTLVERVTGQAVAGDAPLEVNLIMTDLALFGNPNDADADADADARPGEVESQTVDPAADAGVDEPAHVLGHGPVPSELVRRWLRRAGPGSRVWLRRLYRHPDTGQLVSMDSRRRIFPEGQRQFIELRDQRCRTPYCGAPIRHIDHVTPHDEHGPTSIDNGQGYCQNCNHAKQAPGWRTRHDPDTGEITITTPTGHTHRHRSPPPPGGEPAA